MPAAVADPKRSLVSEQISPATIAHHTLYENTPNLHQSHVCQWGAQPYLVGPLFRLVGKPPFSPWLSKNVLPLTKAANGPNSAISLTQTFDRILFCVCKFDSHAYETLIRKWTKSVFFFRDQKHERRPSYAYGFGLLCFRQTRTGLPMRVRYSNEIAEWKWPPIFQNKRVRYARKSRRAGPLQ